MHESAYRPQVIEVVLRAFEDLAVTPTEGVLNRPLLELAADEDITFDFIPGVNRMLGVSPPLEAWNRVYTVNQAIDLWCRALEAKHGASPHEQASRRVPPP